MLINQLHDMGYRFVESGRIGDLTPAELTILQASMVAENKLREEEIEGQQNRDLGRPGSRAATRRKAERIKQERGIQ